LNRLPRRKEWKTAEVELESDCLHNNNPVFARPVLTISCHGQASRRQKGRVSVMRPLIETPSRMALVSLLLGLAAATAALAADLYVPADYSTIQAAVNAAQSNDTIHIDAGVYAGQILISNKSLTLMGAPGAVLRPTTGMRQPYAGLGFIWVPLVGILRSDVVVSNLTFDGLHLGNSQASAFAGVWYLGSGGRVEDCHFTGFRGNTLGSRYANGLRVVNPVGLGTSPVTIQILRSTFTDNYISIALVGDDKSTLTPAFDPNQLRTTFVVSDNTITGNGPNATSLQFGLHIFAGATGEVSRNTISDHAYVGSDADPFSFGILALDEIDFGSKPLVPLQPIRFEGNVLRSNQWHMLVLRGDGSTIVGNAFDGTAPGKRPTGLALSGENVLVASNRFSNMPQGIVLLGDDPDYGTYLGIAHNEQLNTNQFCNVATNIVVEPLATDTEQGTYECPVLTSITSTTNGVRVAWTDPGPGFAYTVKVRESLTSGAWRNGAMRYRWPWPYPHWADAPRSLPAARYYRVLAQPVAIPNRGRLISSSIKGQWDVNFQKHVFTNWGIAYCATPKFGIISRTFTYETVDPYGLSITNSAELILPLGTNGPMPLLSMQHPTLVRKIDASSQPGSGDRWASVLGCYGYAVVTADYLGLGSSPGYQAYFHAKSEATSVVDALRAGKALCASNNITLNGQLFLTGFSQGGHVTMAAHRELETYHTNEFTVTACAPSSGPYDLGGATIEAMLTNPNYPSPVPFAMFLAAYLPIYQLGDTLEELLAPPYRTTLPPLLDGTHSFDDLTLALPTDPVAILRPDYQADFRTNINNPFRQALLANNTYSWTPKAPVTLFHCRGDDVVPYANAEIAYQSFTNRGACCVSLVDPGAPALLNHDDSYNPDLCEVLTWFESLRQ